MKRSKYLYHFEMLTTDEIYHVFATIMSHTATATIIDLWCPENQLLNKRFTAPTIDNTSGYLYSYISNMMVENHIVGILKEFE